MRTDKNFYTDQKIHQYDGYQSEPIWEQKENRSTHYSHMVDKQCTVPIRSLESIKTELGIEI